MRLKETPEDLAVKERLWDATRREILHFAARYLEESAPNIRRTEGQRGVCAAAKKRGYSKVLIAFLGRSCRQPMLDEDGEARLMEARLRMEL